MAIALAALAFLCRCGVAVAADDAAAVNPWRNENGTLAEGTTVTSGALPENDIAISYRRMGNRMLRIAGPGSVFDRSVEPGDVKWRREARGTGIRMRMLLGPEGAFASDWSSSASERGGRNHLGAVMPLNSRWELTVINTLALFKQRNGNGRAGLDAATIRVGANPGASFRPWFEATPYMGLDDRDGGGIGFAGGLSKQWAGGIVLQGGAHLWRPWDEGYRTALHDGRSHGFRMRGTLPVDRRLTFFAEAGFEWLELGSNAPGGRENAGRRGGWRARAEYALLKRDDAFMGHGFRDQTLRDEELVAVELALFAEVSQSRYWRPKGFRTIDPTEKSLGQRVGFFYEQALSPRIGFGAEAFIGRDPERDWDAGELYGASARVNIVLNPSWRLWLGWGYESRSDDLSAADRPSRSLSFGFNYNF